jgi:transcriptional regulator with XRE-family HTH domain
LLIETRQSQKLTQAVVAQRLQKPQSFVSKYERGERRLDVVEFLEVAKALNVNPCELLEKLEQIAKTSD